MKRAGEDAFVGLPLKQRRFVCEYLVDQNAKRAAIRAGYSQRSAEVTACRLLRNAKVRATVEKRLEDHEIKADRVLAELAKIAFANMADYLTIGPDGSARIDFSKISRDEFAGIRELKVCAGGGGKNGRKPSGFRLNLRHKVRALDLLGRYLGLFNGRDQSGGAGELVRPCTKGNCG